MPLTFNWNIDVGQLLNIVAIVVGVMFFIATMRQQLSTANERLGNVEAELKKLSDVVISNARLDERVTAQGLRLAVLEARNSLKGN